MIGPTKEVICYDGIGFGNPISKSFVCPSSRAGLDYYYTWFLAFIEFRRVLLLHDSTVVVTTQI